MRCSTRCAAATPTSCATNSETCCCRCFFTPASPRTRPRTSVHHRRCRGFAGAQARQPGACRACRRRDFAGRSARAVGRAQGAGEASRGVRSVMDDVPTGQPALALAQKVIERVTAAGLPADLIPAAMTSVSVAARRRYRELVAVGGSGVHGHRAHGPSTRSPPAVAARTCRRHSTWRIARGDHRGGVARVLAARRMRPIVETAGDDEPSGAGRIPEPTPADVA